VGLIDEDTIRRVAAGNDIIDVIGSYFPLKRAGTSWRALCPFHNEKSPSFFVNPARQNFHCFGCGANGSVIGFVMDYEKVDFPTAVRRLAARAGIVVSEQELTPEARREAGLRDRLLALHREAAVFFHENLLKRSVAQAAREYLKARGLGREIAQSWQLGYAQESWDALWTFGLERGYTPEELGKSGLFSPRDAEGGAGGWYDRFRDRLMFPICNDIGEVIGFSGRVLQAEAKAAKYVNSPETLIFTKGRVLFGLHKTKRDLISARVAVVCEGQIDLIAAFEAGVRNVIAPQGTAFTAHQAHTLKRLVDGVVLCFDSDAAGLAAAERSLPALFGESLDVRLAELPPGEDPDSTIRKHGADDFRARISGARDFFDVTMDRAAADPDFASPRSKTALAHRLAGALDSLRDPVLREATIMRVSGRLKIPHRAFSSLLGKSRPEESTDDDGSQEIPVSSGAELSRSCQFLCAAALRSAEAKQWMAARDATAVFVDAREAGLVNRLARGEYEPGEPAQVGAFLATLDDSLQQSLAAMAMDIMPDRGRELAEATWTSMERQRLEDRRKTLMQELAGAGGSEDLRKEFLEIQKRLSDIPPLSVRTASVGSP